MQFLARVLFAIYLFSMPIVGSFTIGTLISIPFVTSLLLILILPLMIKIKPIPIPFEMVVFFIFIIYGIFSYLVNTDVHSYQESINHFISIVYAITVFFMIFYYLYIYWDESKYISCWMLVGIVASVIFGFIEFYSKSILGNIANIIPRSEFPNYYPIIFGTFYRIRSFVSESGHYASYLISIGLITYSFFIANNKYIKKNIFILLSTISLLMTFSFSGIVFLMVAFLLYGLVYNSKSINQFIISISFSIFLIVFSISVLELIFQMVYKTSFIFDFIFEKFSSDSAIDRLGRIYDSYNIFINSGGFHYLFGLGPAYFYKYQIPAPLSLYLTVLFQYGIVGLLLFLAPFLMLFYRIKSTKNTTERKIVVISMIYILLHFLTISNYWYPWLWFCLAFNLVFALKGGIGERN